VEVITLSDPHPSLENLISAGYIQCYHPEFAPRLSHIYWTSTEGVEIDYFFNQYLFERNIIPEKLAKLSSIQLKF